MPVGLSELNSIIGKMICGMYGVNLIPKKRDKRLNEIILNQELILF